MFPQTIYVRFDLKNYSIPLMAALLPRIHSLVKSLEYHDARPFEFPLRGSAPTSVAVCRRALRRPGRIGLASHAGRRQLAPASRPRPIAAAARKRISTFREKVCGISRVGALAAASPAPRTPNIKAVSFR